MERAGSPRNARNVAWVGCGVVASGASGDGRPQTAPIVPGRLLGRLAPSGKRRLQAEQGKEGPQLAAQEAGEATWRTRIPQGKRHGSQKSTNKEGYENGRIVHGAGCHGLGRRPFLAKA